MKLFSIHRIRKLFFQKNVGKILFLILISCSFLEISGCASQYSKHLVGVRNDFYLGNVEEAQEKIKTRAQKAPSKEQDLLELNSSIIDFCSGNIYQAEKKLQNVRDHFDEIEDNTAQKTSENILTYWTDDNFRSYPGEDYEKVLIRVFLTLTNLFRDGEDAQAYSYQIAAKQDEIVQKGKSLNPENEKNPKLNYSRIAFGPYLQGLLWESTWMNQSDAVQAYQKVVQWKPEFQNGHIDLKRSLESVPSRPGNGVVYVFALVGRGPCKEQEYAEATTVSLLIADRIFSAVNKYSVPPTVAPVAIPAIRIEESPVKTVGISVDGTPTAATETILDVNQLAAEQFEINKDEIIARAVVRRIVKKGTLYAAKEIGKVNDWVSLATDIGGVVWEALETADTRCWGVLPAQIQVARLELPIGEHEIALQSCNQRRDPIGQSYSAQIKVSKNQNTYLLVNFPEPQITGKIVVDQHSTIDRKSIDTNSANSESVKTKTGNTKFSR